MLSAATSWIRPMVTMVTAFSIWNAFSNCRFCSIQLVATSSGPMSFSASVRHLRRQVQIIQLQLDLVDDIGQGQHLLRGLKRRERPDVVVLEESGFENSHHAKLDGYSESGRTA